MRLTDRLGPSLMNKPMNSKGNRFLKILCCASVSVIYSLLQIPSFAATRTWTGAGADNYASTPANWGGTAPQTGDDIVLDAGSSKNMTWNMTNMPVASWTQSGYLGTVTVATVYTSTGFTNLNITGDCVISNGMWTHNINYNVSYSTNRLSATIGGNLVIGPDAMIDVIRKGYPQRSGPGQLPGDGSASHGGHGWAGGPCYGSIVAPTNLGSGGRDAPGGGAILLTVRGGTMNNGLVCADGSLAAWGAGSGGSICLNSGTLIGNGAFRANGGKPTSDPSRDSGGGRISLIVTNAGADFSGFTGTNSAYSGRAAAGSRASAGTIYLEKQADLPGNGELIVNNFGGTRGYSSANTDLNGTEAVSYEFSRITLTNGAVLGIGSDDTLIITNTELGLGGLSNGIWISGGTLQTVPDFVFSNIFIGISATGSIFNPSTSLTVGTNAEFRVDKSHIMTNDLIIKAGGSLTHTANTTNEAYKMELTINGSLTVQTGGSVDVTAKGYASKKGPGTGWGGSYGGRGYSGGPCYGSLTAPTNLGSGGNTYAGGGAIFLTVSEEIRNDGLFSANGGAGNYSGSGGTIHMIAGTLTGNGPIRANAGAGGWSGAGGRIAMTVTNAGADFSLYSGSIQSLGDTSGTRGGAGTIYLRIAGQGPHEGALIIDNNSINANATEINSNVNDTIVGNVHIQNSGHLLLCTNQTLTVNGVWSNGAGFEAEWDSQIIFAGGASSTSTVYGSNTFMGFICTNTAGKTLLFEAGRTNTIAPLGRLVLQGSETTTNLVLRSTSDGTPWKLNVDTPVDQSVMYVDVKDSDALPGVGAQVIAINSLDRGGNTNWVFMHVVAGQTNTWTGNSDTVWSMSANWSLDRPPVEDDFIVIPSNTNLRYPVLDNHRTVNGIEIHTGASLSLAGYDLTVKTNAVIAGAVIASGSETITFQADANFTGGAFTPTLSTILFSGTGNQSINLANLTFFKINVLNSAGTVLFGNGFSATELRCEAAGGTRNITFQQGATVILRDFVMLGAIGNTNITLRSSAGGQKWNLAVSGYRSVRGVDVRDSDASSGLPITAMSSLNSGGNVNWTFDATQSVWLGTSGNNFHLASNWNPAVVPDAGARVLMDSANPMTITGAVTLLDLTVGGGAGYATATVNAAMTVIENIFLLTNGTLVLNQSGVVSNGLYVLAGGTLTHSANGASEVTRLDLTVCGDVEVDVNGSIDVTAKGYAPETGPGFVNNDCCGSYGGRAWGGGPCYGSIVAPTNIGSGSRDTRGGGAILFTVHGMIRNDGLISADGGVADYGGGAGGTIRFISGTLIGSENGIIRANAGRSRFLTRDGGGGRVSLVVTNAGADFSLYAGSVLASGGGGATGGGTIYREPGGSRPGYGTVLVDNNASGYTDVPPLFGPTGEVDRASFFITNSARLRLTNDFTVGDIQLTSPTCILDLGATNLHVNAFEHDIGSGIVTNYGAIIWYPLPKGTVFFGW